MNVTFIGGGSLRILPIVRSLLEKSIMNDGSIRLIDCKLDRAEAVGRLIKRCPEFKGKNCRVMWTSDLETGIEGTDALYVTMAVEREPSAFQSWRLSLEYNMWHSDMLSPAGAFLSARAGGMILRFAQIMEKCSPNAIMLIFANPVPVFSALVNNHTRIRALGICQGFRNHKFDIPRLTGDDAYHDEINVIAAGVNHFSFILRGKWGNKDIFDVLNEYIDAESSFIEKHPHLYDGRYGASNDLSLSLLEMARTYRRTGQMLFSSEGDGIVNLNYELGMSFCRKMYPLTADPAKLAAKAFSENNKKFEDFIKVAAGSTDPEWHNTDDIYFGIDRGDVANDILSALKQKKSLRITASAPNSGAVAGFTDRTVLEYTMDVSENSFSPVENQMIPAPYHGLISTYAEHQTLLADAIATEDSNLFAKALDCYPIMRFVPQRDEFYQKLFSVFDDMPPYVKRSVRYFSI